VKNWKDQLNALKSALRGSKPSGKGDEKPSKIDFEPPQSWLSGDSSESIPVGRAKGRSSATPSPASVDSRQTSVEDRITSTVQKPIRPSDTPSPTNLPAGLSTAASNVEKTPVFRPRLDLGRSLNTPEWISLGKSLHHQYQQSQKAAPMVVRIGVDFGTAFTKVAIRAGVDLVTVDWAPITGDESPIGRSVMPGLVVRGRDGEYSWRHQADSEIQGNLKLPAIERVGSNECPVATLAFLALAIRYARAFLYRHPEVGRKLMARSLRWELNLGCPTEPHENLQVVELFERLARTAWQLAARDGCREADVIAAWRSDEISVGLETAPCVVPEFVAQIAGYLRSPQVTEGLHAMIDVGAATVDVATFNVVMPQNGDSVPRIPIFFSTVRPLGTHYLSHNRHSKLGLDLEWDDAVPVDPADEFAHRHGKLKSEVDTVDAQFESQVTQRIVGVIDSTRTSARGVPGHRDQFGHYSEGSVWAEGLPIFVTGGGASCEVYRRAIDSALIEMKRRMGVSRSFRFIELDPLGGMDHEFDLEVGSRLTVAIGLTEDAEDIARVIPHRDIEAISPGRRQRVDHTEIYGDH